MEKYKKQEEIEKREESLLDAQINYYRLMFNKLREIKSLNRNFKIAKSAVELYLDENQNHDDAYEQEKEALRYCLKNIKKIKQYDEELNMIKAKLQDKTNSVYSVLKTDHKSDELTTEINDVELLIEMTLDECEKNILTEYNILKKKTDERKKQLKNEMTNLNNK